LQVDIFRLNEIDLWNAILLNPEACILKAGRAHFSLISCFTVAPLTFLFLILFSVADPDP
jgi:hypothetical protein